MEYTKIGDILKAKRKEKNYSVKNVILELKKYGIYIKEKTLYGYENNANIPDGTTLLYLCSIYGIDDALEAFRDVIPNSPNVEIKKEPTSEVDSLEWLRQGLLDFGIIKNSSELTNDNLNTIFAMIETLAQSLKKVVKK